MYTFKKKLWYNSYEYKYACKYIYTVHTHTLRKQKLVFWMRLIAINSFDSTIINASDSYLSILHNFTQVK